MDGNECVSQCLERFVVEVVKKGKKGIRLQKKRNPQTH